jgi:hypothetical protein
LNFPNEIEEIGHNPAFTSYDLNTGPAYDNTEGLFRMDPADWTAANLDKFLRVDQRQSIYAVTFLIKLKFTQFPTTSDLFVGIMAR